jgi:tetratricopeptide (TPR) repeat protein
MRSALLLLLAFVLLLPAASGRAQTPIVTTPGGDITDDRADLLLFEAETALRGGRYDEAAEALNALLAARPDHELALERLAQTYRLWVDSRREVPEGFLVASLDVYARLLENNPRHPVAIEAIQTLSGRSKTGRTALERAAALDGANGAAPDRLKAWRAAWRLDPANLDALLALATLEESVGEDRRAENALRIAFELSEGSAVVRERLGALTRRLANAGPEPERTFYLGRLDLAEGRPYEAAARFRQCLDADSTIMEFRKYTGMALYNQEKYAEALDWLKPLALSHPDDIDVRFHIGSLLFQLNHHAAALQELLPIVDRHRYRAEASYMVGVSLLRATRHDEEALGYLLRAEEAGAADSTLPCLLGEQYVRLHRWDEARGAFERCRAVRPNHPAAALGLGLVADQEGDWSESIRHFESFLAREPEAPAVLMRVGVSWLRVDEPDSALARFRSAIGRDSTFAPVTSDSLEDNDVFELSFLMLMASREYRDGIVVGEHLLGREPESAVYKNNVAMAYADANENLKRGVALAKEANDASPDNAGFLDTLGWLYVRQKKHRDAESTLDRSIELARESGLGDLSEIHYHRGVLFAETGRRTEAIEELRRALDGRPLPTVRRSAEALLKRLTDEQERLD